MGERLVTGGKVNLFVDGLFCRKVGDIVALLAEDTDRIIGYEFDHKTIETKKALIGLAEEAARSLVRLRLGGY
jgi:hypothetical protein